MVFITGLSIGILILYLIVIISFIYGWNRLKEFIPGNENPQTNTSVIIAFRNEEENLDKLVKSLDVQTLQTDKIEFLFINDHSTDNSAQLLRALCDGKNNFKLFELPESVKGKKAAIYYGIENANGELIVTTDADCYMGENWLRSIVAYYEKYKPKLISAPVIIENDKSWFANFQSVELLSLIGSGAGAIGINRPIMCNAANMAFEKGFYLKNQDLANSKYVSGDDIFFLLNTKKIGGKQIHFIKSHDAFVYTKPLKTMKEFVHQRIRWVSKSSGYRDFDIGFVSIVIYLMNLMILLLTFLSFTDIRFLIILLVMFFIKSGVDSFFLNTLHKYFYQKLLNTFFKMHQLVNILLTAFIPILAIFSPFKWKGRMYLSNKVLFRN